MRRKGLTGESVTLLKLIAVL